MGATSTVLVSTIGFRVSAGAIVAAYYAAVGLELEEMIQDAETSRP
jgi:hypothetical protein